MADPDARPRDPRRAARRSASACRSTTSAPAGRRSATCAQLPVDEIKIDRSFVTGMAERPQRRDDRALDDRPRPQPRPARRRRGRRGRGRCATSSPRSAATSARATSSAARWTATRSPPGPRTARSAPPDERYPSRRGGAFRGTPDGPARCGAGRRPGRVRPARRAAPARAARALLPDARLAARRRGRLQDAMLRAWRGLPRFEGEQLAAAVALPDRHEHLARSDRASGPKRVLPPDHCAAADPSRGRRQAARRESCGSSRIPTRRSASTDGYAAPEARYEQRESVELAFIAALQHLAGHPARRAHPARGARLLRPGGRRMFDTSVPSVNSALQRARTAVDERLPERQPAGDAADARRRES